MFRDREWILHNEYKSLRDLQQFTGRKIHIEANDDYCPDAYDISLDIESLVDKTGVIGRNFRIKLDLRRYPERAPLITFTSKIIPLHPLIKRLPFSSPKWIDSDKYFYKNKRLCDYLLRFTRLLSYDDEHIFNVENKDTIISDKKALKVYRKLKEEGLVTFPLKCELPRNISEFKNIQTKSSVKFEIVEETAPHKPVLRDLPQFHVDSSSNSLASRKTCHERQIYIKPNAFRLIKEHIGWDRIRTENCVEQGGILTGKAYTTDDGIIYSVVDNAIPATMAQGSSAYLEMNHETWVDMLNKACSADDKYENSSITVVGWYHTHPNTLDVFMSGTDIATQKRLFSHDWQFALVFNPHKRIWKAYSGEDVVECAGYVIANR